MRSEKHDRIRVLVNGLHAKSGGGVTYLRNILSHLAGDERLELHLVLHEDQLSLFAPVDARVQLRVLNFNRGFWYLMLWEQAALPVLAHRMSAGVTFSPANYGPLFAPNPVIMLRNALSVGSGEQRLAKRLYWAGLTLMTVASLATCRRAIAVSHYARQALSFGRRRWLDDKVEVVYHGVNPLFSPGGETRESEPFLLVVADIYIQKNLHTLIRALAILRRRFPALRLKIAGRRNDEAYYNELITLVDLLRLRDGVEFLGHKREDELLALYRDCSVFVLPSTVETFGNPLAEAMACGAPVATSNAAAMPEIVGDGALLFDPLNAPDMADKIARLLDEPDLARETARRGHARSTIFSWQRAARETADILVAAASARHERSPVDGRNVKVLINAISARRGGIVTYTSDLVRGLRSRHIDATIALPPTNPEIGAAHTITVDVERLGAVRRFLWEQLSWRGIVRRRAPDVLFSSANFGLLRCPAPQLLMMSEGGVFNPLYLDYVMPRLGLRLRILNRIRRVLMLRSIKAAPVVVLPTETLYRWILKYCPQLETRGVINSYGIDLRRFAPKPARRMATDRPVRLLYVSVYYPHKDPETLNRAVRLLHEEGIEAIARITMAEPEFRPWPCGETDFRRLKEGERKGYIRLGSVRHDELPAAYGENDIFVFPSVSETFGFPLVEAMACGQPVLAADTETNREICGDAARYFPPFGAAALAGLVKELRDRPDLYRAMREAGIARAKERFDLSDHFDRLAAVLDEMGRGHPRHRSLRIAAE